MQKCACIIQSNGLGRQAAKGSVQHAGNERCKSWCLVDEAAGRQQKVQKLGLGGQVGWGLGQKGRRVVRGRESRQPNVTPASLPKVTSE
jgi:hypothetical protein